VGRKRHLAKAKKEFPIHVKQETTRLTEKNAKTTEFYLKNYDRKLITNKVCENFHS